MFFMQKENNDLNRSFKYALTSNEPASKYFSTTGGEKSKNKSYKEELRGENNSENTEGRKEYHTN